MTSRNDLHAQFTPGRACAKWCAAWVWMRSLAFAGGSRARQPTTATVFRQPKAAVGEVPGCRRACRVTRGTRHRPRRRHCVMCEVPGACGQRLPSAGERRRTPATPSLAKQCAAVVVAPWRPLRPPGSRESSVLRVQRCAARPTLGQSESSLADAASGTRCDGSATRLAIARRVARSACDAAVSQSASGHCQQRTLVCCPQTTTAAGVCPRPLSLPYRFSTPTREA